MIEGGQDLPRPELADGAASDEVSELDQELQELRDRLLADVPADAADRSDEERARFALAHMMEFHRREDKASWWEYFRLCGLPEDELLDERRAVGGLEFVGVVDEKARVQRYRFPEQDLDVRNDDPIHDLDGNALGEIASVDYSAHTIDVKKQLKTVDEHPRGVVLHRHVRADSLRDALKDLGKAVLDNGFALGEPHRAAVDLLLRRAPAVGTQPSMGRTPSRPRLASRSRSTAKCSPCRVPRAPARPTRAARSSARSSSMASRSA